MEKSRQPKKQLPYAVWPDEDRERWEKAFATGNPFDGEGPGARLAEASQRAFHGTYGRFLGFLTATRPARLAMPPARRLTVELLKEYVAYMRLVRIDSSIATELYHLRLALKYLAPEADWSWLLTITKRIAAQAPKTKKRPFLSSEQLRLLGCELMDEAMASSNPYGTISKSDALKYRDGLLIAFLADAAPRRRSLAALRIGVHLVKVGDCWILDMPAKDMKNRRATEYPLSRVVSARLDVYLRRARPRIPGSENHDGLWASNKRHPMDDGSIYDAVRRRTQERFGFAVNLHLARTAVGNLWVVQDPANIQGVKDVLGHSSFGPTEKYYIPAQSRMAGRALAAALKKKLK